MGGVNDRVWDKPHLRIVTVDADLDNPLNEALIWVTEGSRVLKHTLKIIGRTAYVTFWVDVSGEMPFDQPDVVIPEGWDYRNFI